MWKSVTAKIDRILDCIEEDHFELWMKWVSGLALIYILFMVGIAFLEGNGGRF